MLNRAVINRMKLSEIHDSIITIAMAHRVCYRPSRIIRLNTLLTSLIVHYRSFSSRIIEKKSRNISFTDTYPYPIQFTQCNSHTQEMLSRFHGIYS